jgi:hypothetical protein
MSLVLRIHRQFEIEAIVNMNVGEDASFVVLDDLLALEIKLVAFALQSLADQGRAVYIRRAASRAIAWRSLTSAISFQAPILLAHLAARGCGRTNCFHLKSSKENAN